MGLEHFDLDDVGEYLLRRKNVFFNIIKKYGEKWHEELLDLGKKHKIKSKDDLMSAYIFQLGKQDRKNEFELLHQFFSTLYVGERLKSLKRKNPIFNGAFINPDSRDIFYQAIGIPLIEKVDLDAVPKVFVYFNQGLELSLERYNQGRAKREFLGCSEKLITSTHEKQEIPSEDEFPNLEVIIIENQAEIEGCIEQIAT